MDIEKEYNKFLIFNAAKNIMYGLVKATHIHHIMHGGNILLKNIDSGILHTLCKYIINSDDISNDDKIFYLNCIYSEDIDILVSDDNIKRDLCDTLISVTHSMISYYYQQYLKFIICYYTKIDPDSYNIAFEQRILTQDLNRITAVLRPSNLNLPKYSYDIYDVYVSTNKHFYFASEFKILLADNKYLVERFDTYNVRTKQIKRFMRMCFFVMIIKNKYFQMTAEDIPFINTDETYNTFNKIIKFLDSNLKTGELKITPFSSLPIKYFSMSRIDSETYKITYDVKNYKEQDIQLTKDDLKDLLDFYLNKNKTLQTYIDNVFNENFTNAICVTNYYYVTKITHGCPMGITTLENGRKLITEYLSKLSSQPHLKMVQLYTGTLFDQTVDYMFSTIYGKSPRNPNVKDFIQHIYDTILLMTQHNHLIINAYNGPFYVYRGENNILVNINGFYDTINKDDIFVIPTFYSTSINRKSFYHKDVQMKILLDEHSKFLVIFTSSDFSLEKEILLPPGSVLQVTQITKHSGKIHIEFKYIGFNKFDNIDDFLNHYKRNYLSNDKSNILLGQSQSTQSIKVATPVQLTLGLNDLTSSSLHILNEVDVDHPYEALRNKTFTLLPPFDAAEAYLGEHIKKDKLSSFCNQTPYNYTTLSSFEHNFNILSINVHNFVKVCPNPSKNISHVLEFLDALMVHFIPTIICMQEVTPDYIALPTTQDEIKQGNYRKLVNEMKDRGFTFYSIVNTTNYQDEPTFLLANAIFSREPFMIKSLYNLHGNRAIQICTIMHYGLIYQIMNTHLEFNDAKTDKNIPIINIQVKQLEILLDKYKDFILIGDFNHNIIENAIFKDILDRGVVLEYGNKNIQLTGLNSQKIIDYFIISKTLINNIDLTNSINSIIPSDISDHYPILLSLYQKDIVPYQTYLKNHPNQRISIKFASDYSFDCDFCIIPKYYM